MRESIESLKTSGWDLADAVEMEKDIACQLAKEGDKFQKYLEDNEHSNMKTSAARIIYLSKVGYVELFLSIVPSPLFVFMFCVSIGVG
jgi:hypothetical protein